MKKERYIRQTTLKAFGPEKQQLLSEAKVLVVGAGGLGIPVLQYLSAMGVGTLGIVEQDIIELSNLQRQVLYGEEDLGKQKIEVALDKLKRLNSETLLKSHDTFLTRGNALDILNEYDLIIDASDNFATRYLINDACIILNKPFVSGAIHGFEGQVSVFNYKDGPTYRCLFPSAPEQGSIPDCNENGVLGVIPGIIGTLQALEAVKVITQTAEIMSGILLLYNGLDQSLRKIKFPTVLKNKERKNLEAGYEPLLCEMEELVSVHSLNENMKNTAHISIIDVRTTAEYAQQALEGTRNVPLNELLDYVTTTPLDKPTYFICQTGIRSQQAIQFLRPRFPKTPMYSVIGGMAAWMQEVASTKNKR